MSVSFWFRASKPYFQIERIEEKNVGVFSCILPKASVVFKEVVFKRPAVYLYKEKAINNDMLEIYLLQSPP